MDTASSPVLAYLKNAAFYEVQATGQMAVRFRIKDDRSAAQRLLMAILLGRAGRQPLGDPTWPKRAARAPDHDGSWSPLSLDR
jgi:hypothetical protein